VWLRLKPVLVPGQPLGGFDGGHRCLLSVIRSAGRPFLKTRKRVIGSSRSRSLPIMSTLGRTLGPASRGSTFLAVMRTCDIEEQVRRIDSADRVARLKGSDPEGYRHYTADHAAVCPADDRASYDRHNDSAARRYGGRDPDAVEGDGPGWVSTDLRARRLTSDASSSTVSRGLTATRSAPSRCSMREVRIGGHPVDRSRATDGWLAADG